MSERRTRVHIALERFRFSCAHMTVFPDGRKERLHGHNFRLSVALELARAGFDDLVDFGSIKEVLAELCGRFRERTLLAVRNPHFEVVREDSEELEFRLCGRRYVLPAEDVLLLPIDNVTVEGLSAHAADLLAERLAPLFPSGVATALEVTIEESPGQGATSIRPLTSARIATPASDRRE